MAVLQAGAVGGQDPALPTAEAPPVYLPVVVRDGKGALVESLGKADVSLLVDGQPGEVRSFEADRNLPLTLGLLVDTGAGQRGLLDDERAASQTFLDRALTGAKDQAFVMQFAREVELLQDVTASKPKLRAALQALGTASPAPGVRDAAVDADDPGERRGRAETRATAFYDAVFLAADEVMRKRAGRKALILFTDGNDRSSKETLAQALEAAERGDTVVYAIYVKGEAPKQDRNVEDRDRYPGNGYPGNGYPGGGYPGGGYPGGGYPGGGYPGGGYPGGGYPGGYPGGGYPRGSDTDRLPKARNDGRKILERMARETGGRLFEATKKQPVPEIYAEIEQELRAQFRLGFAPVDKAAGPGHHQVEVALTGDRKKWAVQTREGYYATK